VMDALSQLALFSVALFGVVGVVLAARGTSHPDEEPEPDGRKLTIDDDEIHADRMRDHKNPEYGLREIRDARVSRFGGN